MSRQNREARHRRRLAEERAASLTGLDAALYGALASVTPLCRCGAFVQFYASHLNRSGALACSPRCARQR